MVRAALAPVRTPANLANGRLDEPWAEVGSRENAGQSTVMEQGEGSRERRGRGAPAHGSVGAERRERRAAAEAEAPQREGVASLRCPCGSWPNDGLDF